MGMPSCLRLLEQLMRAAASRTFWTAGRSRPIRIAMIAITTKSSMRVKPARVRLLTMANPPRRDEGNFGGRSGRPWRTCLGSGRGGSVEGHADVVRVRESEDG